MFSEAHCTKIQMMFRSFRNNILCTVFQNKHVIKRRLRDYYHKKAVIRFVCWSSEFLCFLFWLHCRSCNAVKWGQILFTNKVLLHVMHTYVRTYVRTYVLLGFCLDPRLANLLFKKYKNYFSRRTFIKLLYL